MPFLNFCFVSIVNLPHFYLFASGHTGFSPWPCCYPTSKAYSEVFKLWCFRELFKNLFRMYDFQEIKFMRRNLVPWHFIGAPFCKVSDFAGFLSKSGISSFFSNEVYSENYCIHLGTFLEERCTQCQRCHQLLYVCACCCSSLVFLMP